ncbi:Auxin efflux carrier component 6, variant 2, partial [Lathyrus oleraceus]
MVTGEDLYNVMCAMVPLYFAMLVAYVSVKCCKMFTPEQCSGINRFVAVFAVPVLSFHFISLNNPYQMDTKFILADTVSKVLVLFFLSVWAIFFARGSLDWVITLFSVATLPNTLVMGIPLLQAMYGDFTETLMVQLVVLQCIIWYTVLLFLLEYRAAKVLIKTEFPGNKASSITKFELDGDVISLYGQDAPLQALSETDENGRIKVRIRRSTSSAPADSTSSITTGITPTRLSNLSNADIFSINTPLNYLDNPSASPRFSGYASTDAYSLQPTPRASNVNEMEICG